MNVDELYDLVEKYYGYKVKMRYQNSRTREVGAILYDAFCLKCSLDDRYGRFGAGIVVGNEGVITDFLGMLSGKKLLLDNKGSLITETYLREAEKLF